MSTEISGYTQAFYNTADYSLLSRTLHRYHIHV